LQLRESLRRGEKERQHTQDNDVTRVAHASRL
jgi:hypothetical protein